MGNRGVRKGDIQRQRPVEIALDMERGRNAIDGSVVGILNRNGYVDARVGIGVNRVGQAAWQEARRIELQIVLAYVSKQLRKISRGASWRQF